MAEQVGGAAGRAENGGKMEKPRLEGRGF